ncbi:hypothetical protein DQ239_18730 [Blastococcus sp. TF02-09]|uniref:hypothetical protein n=1 Tax=Blastococcus sp. TF02-09 TaxID=2250576 RepID=UPI000DE86345|nr:hypothetical protein [Blastococcus sp. TF02-9]RBY74825.1 hypothetical protein DQ239_18730 [Blastococcus sp. TF02-9]
MTHLVLPLVGAVVLGGAAFVFEAQRAPQYTSEALVAVLPEDPADEVSMPITSIWAEIADSDSVRDRVGQTLGVSRAELEDDLVVAASEDAPLVSVQATTGNAETSAAWANAAAGEIVGEADGDQVPGYDLAQVTDARPRSETDQFPALPLVGGAAVVGLLAGAGAAQLLDRRARQRAQPASA